MRNAYLLTYEPELFSRSCQLCSYSKTSQHFKEPEGLSPCSHAYKTLIGKLEGKIWDTAHKWEGNIIMDGVARILYGRMWIGFIWMKAVFSDELLWYFTQLGELLSWSREPG
jgi:hypothetical protein